MALKNYELVLEKAQKRIKIADHMLNVTYPVVKDVKLLVGIMDNIFLAIANSITSLLIYERNYKKIPQFENNFDSKFEILRAYLTEKYNISNQEIQMFRDIKNLVLEHKKSPVEFSRKGEFIICSEDYKIKKLTTEDMKNHINKAKIFIDKVNTWIHGN